MPQVNWELAADFTDPSSLLTVRVEQLMLDEPRYSLSMGMMRQDLTLSRYIPDRFLTPEFKGLMLEYLEKGYSYIAARKVEYQQTRKREEEARRVADQLALARREEESRSKKKRQEANHQRRAEENRARARGGTGGGKKK